MNDMFFEAEITDDLINEYHEKKLCGGVSNCASCKQDAKNAEIEAANKKFDEQLWVFTAVNYDTGVESVLYGHATHNVYIHALAQADAENGWLKVTKYVDPNPYKCDYSRCEGHPNEWNYCSATRMYEDMTNDPQF